MSSNAIAKVEAGRSRISLEGEEAEEDYNAQNDNVLDLNPCSFILYYMVLFFAYWFGSARFDMDGDGDFDPEDVQAFLEDKGFLKKNLQKKKKAKPQAKKKPKKKSKKELAKEAEEAERKKAELAARKEALGVAGALDANGDGVVDWQDMIHAEVDGDAAEEQVMEQMMDIHTLQGKPWFMIFECLIAFGLWAVNAYIKSGEQDTEALSLKAGLDTFKPGYFDLRLFDADCTDLRTQPWRYLSYQFTHIGVMHVTMNCFLNVMLGIPLEGMHGPIRMFIMFNVGVFGGACCFFVNNPFDTVVGMSGGCYSLIGMHFADLIMNWHQKKFRLPTLVFILLLAGADISSYLMTMSSENASHSAHMGGAIAGLIIGIMIGENKKVMTHERVIQVICTILGIGLVGGCLAWNYTTWPPTDLWGSQGYCWYRQVWISGQNMTSWQCARCGGTECIDYFNTGQLMGDPTASSGANMLHNWQVKSVSYSVCKDQGWDLDVLTYQKDLLATR
mmetsp:Transcript_26612/g.70249  ORF Transcript_26612/g.70249 Transcript_26612/m.70249 type:complete len:503 (+) Transcript_26612:105-1613(+)